MSSIEGNHAEVVTENGVLEVRNTREIKRTQVPDTPAIQLQLMKIERSENATISTNRRLEKEGVPSATSAICTFGSPDLRMDLQKSTDGGMGSMVRKQGAVKYLLGKVT